MIDDRELDQRLAANLDAVMGEITAPRRSRLERTLLALRVPEPTARLVAATPSLRGAWLASVGVVLLFAAQAGAEQWRPGDQLAVFLALAPLVPVVGVALAYGSHADRAHEVAVAAPLSGLRLLLLRTLAVVVAAAAVTLLAVVAAPTHGWMQLAWLLPALATCTVTLAIGARRNAPCRRRGGGGLAGAGDHRGAGRGRWRRAVPLGRAVGCPRGGAATASLAVERRRLDRWVAE